MTYMSEYMTIRRANRRQKLLDMAGNQCVECGSNENLEFDHIDKTTKKFRLSGAGLDKKWETILEEFDKCQLLCVDCHKKKTAEAVDHNGGHNKIERDTLVHGTVRMYQYGPCKCSLCKLAKRKYRNKEISINEMIIPA